MASRQDKMRQQCAKYVDKNLRENIQFVQLLHEEPVLGVLISKTDLVYTLGTHTEDYFGLGALTEFPKLTKIDSLCGKKLCQFAAGKKHILALSKSGVVYSWGSNVYGQLGNDSTTDSTVPIIVAGDLRNKLVTRVECGDHLSVALTEEGKVFTWGNNGYGQTGHGGNEGSTKSPQLVKDLSDETIVKICCNWASVFCLSREGKLFAFGFNNGNLGIGNTVNQYTPVSPVIPGTPRLCDVASGKYHALALTTTGMLFSWSYNKKGQLGTGSAADVDGVPATQINFSIDKSFDVIVVKIMAEEETSFAMDSHNIVYAWGLIEGEKIFRPTKYDITFPESPIRRPSSGPYSVVADLLKSFDEEETSDFVISVEGKNIHVHKTILQLRSTYFRTMFNNDWKETEDGKVVIEQYSYDVYREFLRYLYCGDLGELDAVQCLRLMDLAVMALDERLAELCAKRVREHLNLENVLEVFSLALTLRKEELVDYCVTWSVDNGIKKVLTSDAFREIPSEHVREFIHKCVSHGVFDTL